jgi:HK97 gp10 family phage protein
MDGITFRVEGLDKMIAALGKMSKKVEAQVVQEFNASALKIQSDAKKNVPVNLGTLRNSIQLTSATNGNKIIYTVGTSVSYAPYIEFGTPGTQSKENLKIPAGYEDFAMQFKGKSQGKFKDMVLALAEWVTKQGIVASYSIKTQRRTGNKKNNAKKDLSAAWAIAISIIRKGVRAHPYLIPAFEAEKINLRKKIKDIIRNAKS